MTKKRTLTPEAKVRSRFFRDKAVWRRRVKRVIALADSISQRHMQGDYISMGDLYESGREVFATGERGVLLRHRMDGYGVIRRERVHESIASTCKLLQSASEVIQKIADKQGTALVDFPVFVSSLAATSSQELGAQDALKSLMEDIDGAD
jgi:hypothetical protein